MKLFPYFLFEKYVYILALKWPAQRTGTVPIVSAHFRSLILFSGHDVVNSNANYN